MHALQTWPDEHAYLAEMPARRRSDELDLGATWRAAGSSDTWRLAWLRDNGELYACRNDSLVGGGSSVHLLLVLPQESQVDTLLEGWRAARDDEDGLGGSPAVPVRRTRRRDTRPPRRKRHRQQS